MPTMNTLTMVVVILGAVFLIGLGLVSLVQDLLGRGPHEAPLIEDDGLRWPPRYQGSAAPSDPAVKVGAVGICDGGRR